MKFCIGPTAFNSRSVVLHASMVPFLIGYKKILAMADGHNEYVAKKFILTRKRMKLAKVEMLDSTIQGNIQVVLF